jgi:selenocysteine lyase/cysteine desulfurase
MTEHSSRSAALARAAELSDSQLAAIRAALGLGEHIVTVNAGSTGPVCRSSILAAQAALDDGRDVGFPGASNYLIAYEELTSLDRHEVAMLLGCAAEEVALCESTTVGLNILLWGLDLAPGDEILTTSLENPAAIVPLRQVANRRGAQLGVLEIGTGEVDIAAVLAERITAKTRVLLISDVNFVSGARVNLPDITRIAHERGVLVFADGVQAAGTCAIDVHASGVDGYAIARHKFLCGPGGAGAVYVSPAALERIHPTFTGVFSDAHHGHEEELTPFPGARRFEVSTRSLPVTAGAVAAMRWLRSSVGWNVAYERTHRLGNELLQRLNELEDIRVLTPAHSPGGLVSFVASGCHPEPLMEHLAAEGVASRSVPAPDEGHANPSKAIRLSIGVWNRAEDPQRVATIIDHARRSVRVRHD